MPSGMPALLQVRNPENINRWASYVFFWNVSSTSNFDFEMYILGAYPHIIFEMPSTSYDFFVFLLEHCDKSSLVAVDMSSSTYVHV